MDVGIDPLQTWFWAWVIAGLVIPPALLCPHYQCKLLGIALSNSSLAAMSNGRGPSLAFMSSSLAPPYLHNRAYSLCFPGQMKGSLIYVMQLMMGRYSSFILMTLGPTFPPATGSKGRGAGKHLSTIPTTIWQMRGLARSHILIVSRNFTTSHPCHLLYCSAKSICTTLFTGCSSW